MDLKCSNIKIFIIHVAIDFSENLIRNYGKVLRKKWTHCGLKKCVIVISKLRLKNRPP
jgi:hypothetical protein